MIQHPRWSFFRMTVSGLILLIFTACGGDGSPPGDIAPTSTSSPTSTPTVVLTITPTHAPTSTLEPTETATIAPTKTWTATTTPVTSCPGAPELVLKKYDWAMVSMQPPIPNKVRSQPSLDAEEIGQILPGEKMLVVDGPRCADGYSWWYVQSFNGLEGWTAEGDAENAWLIPLRPSAEWEGDPNSITLTAGQVNSAVDIEAAIKEATAEGTRAGTVILDGRDGPFVFLGDDRTINIFVSNLSLVGVNQAVIEGCDGGLFFDDSPIRDILVEGMAFDCSEGYGVETNSAIQNVILRNNVFRTSNSLLSLGGPVSDWLITLNRIETRGGNGIEISGAEAKIMIANNHVTSYDGIFLRDGSGVTVRENILHVQHDGIVVHQGSTRNLVERNIIMGVFRYGIFLTSGIAGNQVLENTVYCKPNYECLTVYAPDQTAETNTIRGNRP